MALDATKVRVGVTGKVMFAPTGTALPTTSIATPNVAFVDVGYIGEDGVTQSIAEDSTDIKAWQDGAVVRKVQTSHDVTFTFVMIESNAASLKAYYGNYTSGVIQIKGDVLPHQAMLLDVIDGTHEIRVVLPDAQITERGDVVYANGEAIGYEVTVTAYPDSGGVKAYKYVDVDA